MVARSLESAKAVSSADYSKIMEELDSYRSAMLGFMNSYDAIVCPAFAYPALPHGQSREEGYDDYSHTSAYNLVGWPGAVVRGGTSPDGLPIGVQVVARPWREDVALALVKFLEDALGGWQAPGI